MLTFQVPDMTCGHCASAISRALAAVDKDVRLDIRVQQKLVRIASAAPAAELAQAIQDAGYTPREVREDSPPTAAPGAAKGCGCGCGTRNITAVERRQASGAAGGSCCG
jgi:copper chaperone